VRVVSLLIIILCGPAAAQGLPGRPVLPSKRPTVEAAPVDSAAELLGSYAMRGEVTTTQGAAWPLSSRVTLLRAGGALELTRAWDIALPGGVQRRVEATTRDVRVQRPGVVEATLRLEGEWVAGLTGAVEGSTGATTKVVNELALELFLGTESVSESVANVTRRAPEHFWTSGWATGLKLAPSDLAPAPAVTTLVSNGPPSERYDITFVPDGYTEADLPAFRAHVRASVAALKATSPFKEYWSYLNIHRVDVASPGGGLRGGRGGPGALGSHLPPAGKYGVLPAGDDGKVRKAAGRAPGADATVVLCQEAFRSVALDGYTLVSTWEDRYPRTVVHELGHVIGKLLDEYEENDRSKWDFIYANDWVEGVQRWTGWGANVTTHRRPDDIPWRRWIPTGTPLPTPEGSGHRVGLYEGALHMSRYWHRPSETCLMRDSTQPFCPVCREQLVLSLSVKTFPLQVQKERVNRDTWRLTLHHSIPGRPRFTWKRSAGFTVGHGPVFVATRADSPWGEAPLWCEVEDGTDFVRNDPEEKTVFVVHFVVRKGYVWDKGLDLRGPWRAPAPGE
jgi:hypothetical protein